MRCERLKSRRLYCDGKEVDEMIRYIYQKIKNQKWLSISLVLGISLLIAIMVCQPIFQNGCQNKMLQRMFVEYIEKNNKYPVVFQRSGSYMRDERIDLVTLESTFNQHKEIWKNALPNWDVCGEQSFYYFSTEYGTRYYYGKSDGMEISYLPEMEEHIQMNKGEGLSAETPAGTHPCIVSDASVDRNHLALGEIITFENVQNEKEEPLVLVVTGIFSEKDSRDLYWYRTPNENYKSIFVSEETFSEVAEHYNCSTLHFCDSLLLDYTQIQNEKIDQYFNVIQEIQKFDDNFSYSFKNIQKVFLEKRSQINVMIWVLELPIIGMMLAFLYMVSNQIVNTGKGQIATLMSRGFLKRHIILMYFLEYMVLAFISFIIGVPMGYGICKLIALATDFMTFNWNLSDNYCFIPKAIPFGVGGMLVAILFVLIPVIGQSKRNIVEVKSSGPITKKMIWEKYFLELILLSLSLYFLYNFNKTIEEIRARALLGNKVDPVIFLNVCLFILSFGFLIFRLMHYMVQIVYRIGKKKWKPVAYASFLQIDRTFRKQTFISVFIILTVAFGIFDACVARTINRNYENRVKYDISCDAVLQEKWTGKTYPDGGTYRFRYIEPNELRYQSLVDKGYCESYTKVKVYEDIHAKTASKTVNNVQCMAIDTKPFGNTGFLQESLYGDEHWYHSLNKLSMVRNGVIISDNMAREMNVNVGDKIDIYEEILLKENNGKIYCEVVDIVEAFPGFKKYETIDGVEKENYLALTHLSNYYSGFELSPYMIWLKKAPGVSDEEIYDYLTKDMKIVVTSYKSLSRNLSEMKQYPEIQIINGLFTLTFLIALILCGVGFMIYWIINIKQRELLLGSYRAMGLSVRSVNRILIYEHLFSTLPSVIGGGTVGFIATLLYINLFSIVYLPEKSVLNIQVFWEASDIEKMFIVVGVMILVCLLIIRGQIKKMNITQALKLGED